MEIPGCLALTPTPLATTWSTKTNKRTGHPISRVLCRPRLSHADGGNHPSRRSLAGRSSNLPEHIGRTTLERVHIWSCSGWGLPSFLRHRRNWWSLTPPFHPYPAWGRSVFCGTSPHVTVGRGYLPPCAVEPGLSSRRILAIAWVPCSALYCTPEPSPFRIDR